MFQLDLKVLKPLVSHVDNIKVGPEGSVLTVSNARPGNQGQYRCVAVSSAGRGSASAVLNIKRELFFTD